jgi:hypothetical protein
VKGQSANPGGRPKALQAVEDAARSHTADALATLARICKDSNAPPAAQVAAANALLDRGWGRPKQAIEASGTLTLEQLILACVERGGGAQATASSAVLYAEPRGPSGDFGLSPPLTGICGPAPDAREEEPTS